MSTPEHAMQLLGIDKERLLQPFDVVDPITGHRLEGWLSQMADHRYGALVITHVDGRAAPQVVYATPKLHYPFGKDGIFQFPPVKSITIYDKLDGTNVLAYRFRDADGGLHLTYKLRLWPVLRNGRWGNFLDMWRSLLERHPQLPAAVEANGCSLSFELYGKQNEHLIVYENELELALLFGVSETGDPIAPHALNAMGLPTATRLAELRSGADPVAEYDRVRARLEKSNTAADDDKIRGTEGAVWYVATTTGETVLFKCKPESVEAVHWATGINKSAVRMTCWNLLETKDHLDFEGLLPLLLEEWEAEEVTKYRPHIDDCIREVNDTLGFRDRVLDAYAAVGVTIDEDKRTVMRGLSQAFGKHQMSRVYAIIRAYG